ncbi:hypothetical protein L208DRAFT_1412071 [Tricholoma matsutake]|nr:hypothetical protein L208DRAFT_1412071 [Tricholoma matsutake 945]
MMVRTTMTSKWVNIAMDMIWRKKKVYKSQGPAHPQCCIETTSHRDNQCEDYDHRDHDQILVHQQPDTRCQDNEHINTEPPCHQRHHSSSQSGTPALSHLRRVLTSHSNA